MLFLHLYLQINSCFSVSFDHLTWCCVTAITTQLMLPMCKFANAWPSHMELNCLPRILHVCKQFLVHTKNIHICSSREWWATLFIIFVRKLYWENMIKPIDSINNLEHMFSCMALVFRCAVALLIRVGQTPFTLSIFELWQRAWPAFSNIHRETLREHESQILNF